VTTLVTRRTRRCAVCSLAGSALLAATVVALGVAVGCRAGGGAPGGLVVNAAERAVEFAAVVRARAWDGGEMAGYHLIVWRDGGSADAALFRADASDVEVLDALESLGALPGNALDVATWDERNDPSSWKPDQVIQGPPVEVSIRAAPAGSWLRLEDVIDDPMGVGFDLRLGGHRANIPAWKSGCVVCLYSCPGSKVGNARYTVRDFAKKTTRFAVKAGVLPRDGERVTIRLRLPEGA
jgi:hypothetical protein